MKRGFTLIELSIVLVIIGLIAGGVMMGKDLIRVAEVRATLTQIERYNTATNTFQKKYGCFPGDCNRATRYFGAKNDCSENSDEEITGTETCNGDGNSQIGFSSTNGYEHVWYWQHLSAAGLVDGRYTAADYNLAADGKAEQTLPAAKFGNGTRISTIYGQMLSSLPEASYHVNIIGQYPVDENLSYNDGVIPEIGFAIDSKLDDGNPLTGRVLFLSPSTGHTCDNGGSPTAYDFSGDDCTLFMKTTF